MTFRIEAAARGGCTIFILSDRIQTPAIDELRKLFESQTEDADIALDLKAVSLINRAVMHSFARCEADGVRLENCPSYIREWIEREKRRAERALLTETSAIAETSASLPTRNF